MLKLHGFSASNYYNVAKLALLEKGVPFEEVTVYTGAGPELPPGLPRRRARSERCPVSKRTRAS